MKGEKFMSRENLNKSSFASTTRRYTKVDQGLRTYMLGVYNYMLLALALTGLVSYAVGSSPALLQAIFASPMKWVVMFAPLGFVMALSFGIQRMSATTAQLVFWSYAIVNGISLSFIFALYSGESIARVFFITSAMFGTMSLYGYTTKKDLTGMGSFLFMGLIGLIIASLVNLFMQSSAMDFIISFIGVLVFAGLTAYDTQKIKDMYYACGSASKDIIAKVSIMGALTLYLDFINLMLYLLRFLGRRD